MIKNPDGSVTLTKEELEELNKAYQQIVGILDGFPAFLGDYFCNEEDYINARKWDDLLDGKEFVRSNWLDEEYEE